MQSRFHPQNNSNNQAKSFSILPESHSIGSTKYKNLSLYCPIHVPRAVQIAKLSFCTAQISRRGQYKLQNRPSALPESHFKGSATSKNFFQHCPITPSHQIQGSAKTKTAILYCPNLTPRAVSQTKTHHDTAISQPPTNSQAVSKPNPSHSTAQSHQPPAYAQKRPSPWEPLVYRVP